MPIYEYRCQACGNEFEKLILGSSGGDGVSCPSCGGSDVAKKLSVFAAATSSSSPPHSSPSSGCGACNESCPNRR
ncbi:MAG: hypothetical protein A2V83_08375 [Nitrospirae bacterium RBG_16_64_22]|nr:MAG: hypothetical protein A2V83_08375 [Nitrospirae bacterium RBG_16_64_22]